MTFTDSQDHYKVLGVPRTATTEEIEQAYRTRAKQSHPDVGGDEEKFKRLQEARNTLRDPEARRRYDGGDRGTAPRDDPDPWNDSHAWYSSPPPPWPSGSGPPTASPPGADPWASMPPPPTGPRPGGPPSGVPRPGPDWGMPPPPTVPRPSAPPSTVRRSTNGWAIASVVLTLCSMAPLAFAAAAYALHQIRSGGHVQRGSTRSVLVLVITGLQMSVLFLRLL